MSRQVLPFLRTYRLHEIDYAVLSAYVSSKLERNEEIELMAMIDAATGIDEPVSPQTLVRAGLRRAPEQRGVRAEPG